jgi:hypothetical protein
MTGIFKSRRLNNRNLMKHLGLGHILLIIGVGLLLGQATAELTAFQNLMPSSADVGQMVTVTVSLTYNGQTPTQAVVTPSLPYGVVANAGGQSTDLYPGVMRQISYPFTAQQSGSYWIVSEISYAEDGTWRNLRLEAPFTATDSPVTQPQQTPQQTPEVPNTPVPGQDGSDPIGTDQPAMPPDGSLPNAKPPGNMQPGNGGNEGSEHQDENVPAQGEGAIGSETNPT